MALRGFDDYELTLGDEMRGERACLGKTLADAERDLCIKADLIAAIENADADAFPNRSVVPGYVRAYARYLGMNPDASYERFCRQSGFRSPLATFGMVQGAASVQRGAETGAPLGAVGAGLMQSRFVSTPRARRIGAPVSLGGVFSAVALAGLVGGLGYGGYALVQDIQRVGFAPLPEAPAVVADAPVIAAPALEPGAPAGARPDARAYAGGGVLALNLPATLPEPEIARRDGPISAIDPETSGVFAARLELPATPRIAGRGDDRPLAVFAAVTPVDDASPAVGALDAASGMHAAADTAAAAPGAGIVGPDHVALVIADEAWVRVRDQSGAVLFEGLLRQGDRYILPERTDGATLHAGNAGGVFVTVGGALRGPLGAPGKVVRNVSLSAADLRSGVPPAATLPAGLGAAAELQSAAVSLDR